MHKATSEFWDLFEDLPKNIQTLARKNFELLKEDLSHPSLRFKKWVIIGQQEWKETFAPWPMLMMMVSFGYGSVHTTNMKG